MKIQLLSATIALSLAACANTGKSEYTSSAVDNAPVAPVAIEATAQSSQDKKNNLRKNYV